MFPPVDVGAIMLNIGYSGEAFIRGRRLLEVGAYQKSTWDIYYVYCVQIIKSNQYIYKQEWQIIFHQDVRGFQFFHPEIFIPQTKHFIPQLFTAISLLL